MSWQNALQIGLFFVLLIGLAKPLGGYMARVYQGKRTLLSRFLQIFERFLYRLFGVKPETEMNWKQYALALLLFNLVGLLLVYALQRLQALLPFNPQQMAAVPPDLAFNTASSFATNTNWQSYGGESTLSYLTQMAGLTTQNFVSAATGMAVLVAFARGFTRQSAKTLGNFWVDLTRSVLYILLPLALLLAVALVSQGVVQTLSPSQTVDLLQPAVGADGQEIAGQTIALGPVASQVAIKQLGTNGGGYYNVNSAHPLENPTPLTNFLECLAILLIPVALCYTFGVLVKDTRQGWALLAAMTILFVAALGIGLWTEPAGNPLLTALGVDQSVSWAQSGGNMEGKEVRFGVSGSVLWSVATTAASNGSVNSMHDSYTPIGGMVPMVLMQLGEVVYGGVGSGLYGMLVFAVIAVFVAGLMVGRTPEYLGKRIEAFEMKMSALVILVPIFLVLAGTALAVVLPQGAQCRFQQRPPRIQRDPLCVQLGIQQQRQRLCRSFHQ